MKVLMVHNAYQQRGGEDRVVDDEVALLRGHGHEVDLLTAHNDQVATLGRLALVGRTLWSRPAAAQLRTRCAAFRPDVVHVHNSFPLLSPAIHWAAAEAGVPLVQTLHNFRLLCPQAMLLRQGRVCEDCVGHLPWRGALRGCYRGSVVQSTVLAGMLTLHRSLGTWQKKINRFIVLNEFCRAKFIEGGLPAERLVVKPNFVDMAAAPERERERAGLMFAGRLSAEKGLATLAAATAQAGLAVQVLGSGPMQAELGSVPGLQLMGAQPMPAVLQAMRRSVALVLPSICYENFPRTLVEAFACSLPVIASRLGTMAELVQDGVTGLLFEPGNANALADRMQWALANPAAMATMGRAGRAVFEAQYNAERNHTLLLEIYHAAIQEGPRDG